MGGSRTFIISDIHGRPEFLERPLEHGGFRRGTDRLIFAGDVVDGGPRLEECLGLIEKWADEVLVGNHDQAIMLDYWIPGQHPESRRYRSRLREQTMLMNPDGKLRVVTLVEGVIVSHGGLCQKYEQVLSDRCAGDPAILIELLNRQFREAFTEQEHTGAPSSAYIMSKCGAPHRYRPNSMGCGHRPLGSLSQVVGHSPPNDLWGPDFHMIDPNYDQGFRYAVIEDGKVRVETANGG